MWALSQTGPLGHGRLGLEETEAQRQEETEPNPASGLCWKEGERKCAFSLRQWSAVDLLCDSLEGQVSLGSA